MVELIYAGLVTVMITGSVVWMVPDYLTLPTPVTYEDEHVIDWIDQELQKSPHGRTRQEIQGQTVIYQAAPVRPNTSTARIVQAASMIAAAGHAHGQGYKVMRYPNGRTYRVYDDGTKVLVS